MLALYRLSTSSATSMSGLSGRFDGAPMTKLNPLLIAARDGCRERLQGLLEREKVSNDAVLRRCAVGDAGRHARGAYC